MPIYGYRAATDAACDHCRDGFEIRQTLGDPKLETCPECGAPIKKIILSFGTSRGFANKAPSVKKMKEHGFQVLKNEGEGQYRQL